MSAAQPQPPAVSRRDEIVAAATELFAAQGYHGVGMRAIADAVGIRGASIYHHFPSKMDILGAIAVDYVHAFVDTHLPMFVDRTIPVDERLRRIFRDQVLYFWEYRRERAVGLRELSELEPELFARVQADRLRYQHALEQAIRDGQAAGELVVADPHTATLAILGLIQSVNDWFTPTGRMTIEHIADAYASLAVDRILGAEHAAR